MTRPKAILFDLDGTLIDSAPDLAAAVDHLRTARGLESLAFERYRPAAGAGARGLLAVAFGITPADAQYESLREEFYGRYECALTSKTTVFDGIAKMLRTLDDMGIVWGIVTNKSKRFTIPLVAQMPLLRGSACVVCGDTTPWSKPHPQPLLEAARQLGLDPRACWYVGDDRRDIQAGHAAGMQTAAALWGYLGEHAVQDWGADTQLAQPVDLLRQLGWA